MKTIKYITLLLLTTTLFVGCDKDETTPPDANKRGLFKLELEHVFGSQGFKLNSPSPYTTDNNEQVTFTTFKYFVSNIKLQSANGTWVQPESYYLIDIANGAKPVLTLNNVPENDYTAIEFMIGVDSTRNTFGAQTGALATTTGMFWNWNSGYIFLKAEGMSPQATNNNFVYHVGGFGGANKAQRIINLSFGSTKALVREDAAPQAHVMVDVAKLFNGVAGSSDNWDINAVSEFTMPGENASRMANNYQTMFAFDHLHN